MKAHPNRWLVFLFLFFVHGCSSFCATSYYLQDNLVNSCLLAFAPDGTYRQIDVDRTTSAETDRGKWERDGQGNLLVHPSRDGLRFRALVSGPLTIVLDRPGTLTLLPLLADLARRFLADNEDSVFARTGIAEIEAGLPEGSVANALWIEAEAETFSRADLVDLARQIDDLLWSERTNTYILSPVTKTSPALLVLRDAHFQAADLPRVRQEFRVPPGQAPPFYFARVDAETFARRAGRWKVLPPLFGRSDDRPSWQRSTGCA